MNRRWVPAVVCTRHTVPVWEDEEEVTPSWWVFGTSFSFLFVFVLCCYFFRGKYQVFVGVLSQKCVKLLLFFFSLPCYSWRMDQIRHTMWKCNTIIRHNPRKVSWYDFYWLKRRLLFGWGYQFADELTYTVITAQGASDRQTPTIKYESPSPVIKYEAPHSVSWNY